MCFTILMGKYVQMHTDGSLLKYNKPQLYDGYFKKKFKKFHLWKAKLQKSDHVPKVSHKKLYLKYEVIMSWHSWI